MQQPPNEYVNSIVKHFKIFILPWRFDDFIDFMKIKFISKNQYNNNAIFGIQIHFKMSKKCVVKMCKSRVH